jgi:AcrR family transcriptional regulator
VIEEPQNSRSARTRTAILDAAWRLLEKDGAEGANMSAVAQAAGVTRRGLYLHFASRTELLVALRAHVDASLGLERSVQPVVDAPDAVAALTEWVRHLTEYHAKVRVVTDAIDRARVTDADAAAVWAEAMAGWQAGCLGLAKRLKKEGRLAAGWTAPVAADALWSLMVGFSPMWAALVEDRGWTVDEFRRYLTRLHMQTFVA